MKAISITILVASILTVSYAAPPKVHWTLFNDIQKYYPLSIYSRLLWDYNSTRNQVTSLHEENVLEDIFFSKLVNMECGAFETPECPQYSVIYIVLYACGFI